MKIDIDDTNYMPIRRSSEPDSVESLNLLKKLNDALNKAGYPEKRNFAIQNLAAEDCYLLCRDGGFWSVSHVERGRRHWPAFFFDIEDAIGFFLLKVTNGEVTLMSST